MELDDEATLDEEPDSETLHGLMDGSITLNNTDVRVIPPGEFYKINTICLVFHQQIVIGSFLHALIAIKTR